MAFPDVLQRGDDFLSEYPRNSKIWKAFSYGTCVFTIGMSKLILKSLYNVELNHFHELEHAIDRSHKEERGLMTIMNHMSVVDDPFIWAVFPWRTYKNLQNMRWCLGADNVCFTNKYVGTYFSLGQVLATKRFGTGPFQGSIEAMIRLVSPIESCPSSDNFSPTFKIAKPAWIHVYPEGFVLQLNPPFSNSMRYFKWGITRVLLESTKAPIVVPIFTTGFEKVAPEDTAESYSRFLPNNIGADIKVTVGKPIDDKVIEEYRQEWNTLVEKYTDPRNPTDLSDELKYGKDAQELRSKVANMLREHVANIRHEKCNFPKEDERFKSPTWWKRFTVTEGDSDPDVKFIGKNWAIRRLQKFLADRDNEDDINTKKNNDNEGK
ncbi:hypothetical protein Kpol_505p38 [Vanderwaltozyma polyspora DSM 70294]|uniref:Tafazzin family protein n=1 Tax=Vanderwaltozyma polyspora (strain ATCC 22028 / DSM 70294 / BCRC 21397 / CBS 2163 / NBRC 10782 / NRRL Y-8283 / UCD 57-17) TaxID=436907 RepID=A7TNC9_VANPO|nr:uncharacterized protein Kpol_505p38 [Vanderwaltozyma polyspora DSM 70294]EDO16261.1 hypothetical protein Kpol_505p38 [Vanderwaltozyma polyspora DSM 70294]